MIFTIYPTVKQFKKYYWTLTHEEVGEGHHHNEEQILYQGLTMTKLGARIRAKGVIRRYKRLNSTGGDLGKPLVRKDMF